MKKIFLAISWLLSLHPAFGQTEFTQIEEFLRQEAKEWHIPNVAIGITTPEGIVFQREAGTDSSAGNYLIGSVSKTFTALAVMQLVQAGRVALDTPVRSYLPWFETADQESSGKFTVRHLLNQTGGLPKRAGFFTPDAHTQPEIEAQYRAYLNQLDLVHKPGEQHEYCNLNYQVLGQLIQRVSGQSYESYAEEYLFQPLKMNNTFASYTKAKAYGWKNGYQYWFGFPAKAQYKYRDVGLAAGDIASNTTDMCHFLQAMLRQGKLSNGDSLISTALLKQMQTPLPGRYGMGFSIGPWNGLHSIRHTGLSGNYSCIINLLPEKGYGIVILTNCNSMYAVRNMMDGVIRRLAAKETITYPKYELYFHYFMGLLLLWSIFDAGRFFLRWKQKCFPTRIARQPKILIGLVIGMVMATAGLYLVPQFGDIPLFDLPKLQPDIGYSMFIIAILGVLTTILKAFLKSSQQRKITPGEDQVSKQQG